MNSLSWMIFAAGFVDNVNIAVGVFFWGGLVFGSICFVIGHGHKGEFAATYKATSKRLLTYAMIALPFGVFVPSAQTIYLIAASQAGETIVTNPEMREVFNDVKTILKSKLKEQLPKPQ